MFDTSKISSLLEPIAQAHLRVVGDGKAQAEIAAGVALAERGHIGQIDLFVEEVEARGEVAVEKIGLGKAEIHLGALKAAGEAEPDILAFAHQVALGDADVADDAFARGVAGTEGQLAGRLLDHLDHDDDAVGRAAGLGLDLHGLEKAERAQSLARRLDQQTIEGVAFGQAELAPDHADPRCGNCRRC